MNLFTQAGHQLRKVKIMVTKVHRFLGEEEIWPDSAFGDTAKGGAPPLLL